MLGIAIVLGAALAMAGVAEQDVGAIAPGVSATSESMLAADAQRRIAAGSVLVLETLEPLNSSKLKRGDKFALRLAEALSVDGVELLAAGTPGVGEVIHAEAAHGGGTPGELLVAARYLEVGGRRIPLRAFRLGVTGKDNTNLALGVSFAAGPFAHFIRGREIEIPAHTRGEARVAQDTEWVPATAAAAQELPAPTSTATSPSTTTPSE